jgi:hypothetical protein
MVQVGGCRYFALDLTEKGQFTTAEFYGCTVVIIADSRGVIIGHFAEEKAQCKSMDDASIVQTDIIRRLEDAELMSDGGPNTHAWIIHSARTTSIGYQKIMSNLEGHGVPEEHIHNVPTSSLSGTGEFPGPQGKAVVDWAPNDRGGATMNVYIQNNAPTFTQEYDSDRNPVNNCKLKRDGSGCTPKSKVPSNITQNPTPSCTYVAPQPPAVNKAFCTCDGKSKFPLTSIPGKKVPETDSCAYKTLPASQTSVDNNLPPATTDKPRCLVCSQYAENGENCSSMKDCLPQTAQVTVQAGSSPVHVGTLTGTALYTSVSSALEKLCPPVSQTGSATACKTDSVNIKGIDYVSPISNSMVEGELVVNVKASKYNVTSLRDAMIKSAALTAQNSASGKNCYKENYTVFGKKRWWHPASMGLTSRWYNLDPSETRALEARDRFVPTQQFKTFCNAGGFAGVQYYSEYWRVAQNAGAAAYLDAGWNFEAGSGGDFACDFLQGLVTALGVIRPQFTVGGIELGSAIDAVCSDAMDHPEG